MIIVRLTKADSIGEIKLVSVSYSNVLLLGTTSARISNELFDLVSFTEPSAILSNCMYTQCTLPSHPLYSFNKVRLNGLESWELAIIPCLLYVTLKLLNYLIPDRVIRPLAPHLQYE